MRTITTNIYNYSELSKTAKKKVLEQLHDINILDEQCYEFYEDGTEYKDR